MTIHEFADQVPVDTPLGPGQALFVETSQQDHFWTVALDNGALVTFTQDQVRMARNYTRHRRLDDAEMRAIVDAACQPEKPSPVSLPRRRRR
jgi:hypothetical protein